MARSEGFYERFAKSVAPSIFGSLGSQTGIIVRLYQFTNDLGQISRRPLRVSSWAARRRFCRMVCDYEEISMFSCWAIQVPRSPSC